MRKNKKNGEKTRLNQKWLKIPIPIMYNFENICKKQIYVEKSRLKTNGKSGIIIVYDKFTIKEVNVYFIKLGEILHKRNCKSPKNNHFWNYDDSNSCVY